jgi:hypothetical protein
MDGQRDIATNFIFYSKFSVHNILQYYFGKREDDKKPGSIPSDTNILLKVFKEELATLMKGLVCDLSE